MTNEEQWKKNLDEAVLVTTRMLLEQAKTVEMHETQQREHILWLARHEQAMDRHDREIAEIREGLLDHDREMAEIRELIRDLTKRLGGGGNGRSQS